LVDVVRNPIYATGVGLLLFGQKHRDRQRLGGVIGGEGVSVWERMKGWFKGNF